MSIAPGPELPGITCACLVVMDGWGIAARGPGNAIALADTPVLDELWGAYPHAALSASGRSVGLPDGQMGNSEVGHLTLGAGAAVPQTLTLIDDAVAAGELARSEIVCQALTASDRVHLVGMVSEGGVHSAFGHLRALIELAADLHTGDLVLHCFTDGRDTSPTAAAGYLQTLQDCCREAGVGRVASVVGRFYGMDRDRRWERTQVAYDLLVHGRAEHQLARRSDGGTRRLPARRDRRVHHPHGWSAPRVASARRTACSASTSAPTACVRSSARWPNPASARAPRSFPGGAGVAASSR